MKKLKVIIITLVIMFVGIQVYSQTPPIPLDNSHTYSYMRWIDWVQKPKHIATLQEMTEIVSRLAETDSLKVYTLSTGIKYKVPQPKIYYKYILKVVKKSDSKVKNLENVLTALKKAEDVKWGNDISLKVKNYYFSSKYNRVQFIPNYSGNSGVRVLLINGIPTIKLDCGNPLEKIQQIEKKVRKIVVEAQQSKKDTLVVVIKNEPLVIHHVFDNEITFKGNINLSQTQPKANFEIPKQKKPRKKGLGFKIGGVAIGVGTLAYFLLHKKGSKTDSGGPVGAPGHK